MKLPSLTLAQKAIILVALPLVCEFSFVGILAYMLHEAHQGMMKQAATKELLLQADNVVVRFYDTALTFAVFKGTNIETARKAFYARMARTEQEADRLRQLSANADRHVQDLVYDILTCLDDGLKVLSRRDDTAPGDMPAGLSMAATIGEQLWPVLLPLSKKIRALSTYLEEQTSGSDTKIEDQRNIVTCLASGLLISTLLAIGLGLVVNEGTVKRLNVVVQNTHRLIEERELLPRQSGSDETAHLDHVFHDMANALQEARRKERAVVENVADVISSLDENLCFTKVNRAAETIWGYSQADLLGKSITTLVAAEHAKKLQDMFAGLVSSGDEQCTSHIDAPMLKADGSLVEMHWSAHWSAPDRTFFCVALDVSAQKALERMRQEFVAMVSHDLRTPLQSVQVYLESLYEGVYGPISEKAMTRAKLSESSLERLIRLINSLLDLEKLEAGKMQIHRHACQLKSIFEQSVESVRAFAGKHEVELVVDCPPIELNADEHRLVQVTVNLLSNAIKFSPAQGKVTLKGAVTGNMCKVTITDQGRGVPPEYQATIFERFAQVAKEDERQKGGTGLGLPICKAIIEGHDGAIGVDSDGQSGSTFWFQLPLVREDGNEAPRS